MGEAKFVGVDWAKGGWLSIACDADGNWEVKQIRQFHALVEYYGKAGTDLGGHSHRVDERRIRLAQVRP